MSTKVINTDTIERKWYIVDATDIILGRMSTKIAHLLWGKGKPAFSPAQDHGDNIIVVNADKLKVTGNKSTQKTYWRHSTYASGQTITPFEVQMKKDSRKVIIHAVHGMLPKNTLGRAVIKKLHVYQGAEHPHVAQKPEPIKM